MSSEDIGTADTMRERTGESRTKLWVLMRAPRMAVSLGLAAALALSMVAVGAAASPPFVSVAAEGDVIDTMFSMMGSSVITAVALVVSIGQLVISQENGPLGDQRARMSATLDFRSYSSELIDGVIPADPSRFLRAYVDSTEQRAEAVERLAVESGDSDLIEEVNTLVDTITDNGEAVRDQLEGTQFGTFDVVFAALNYNYSSKIYHAERLQYDYADSVGPDLEAALEDLRTSLSMFGPAREHIKTLYFQWALIDLSRQILYAAVPALAVAGSMIAFVEPATFPGSTLGLANILWVVCLAFAVAAFPFLIFISYIMRIATVAKRTLAIGPLILRSSQR